jgi:hypothetical protein
VHMCTRMCGVCLRVFVCVCVNLAHVLRPHRELVCVNNSSESCAGCDGVLVGDGVRVGRGSF